MYNWNSLKTGTSYKCTWPWGLESLRLTGRNEALGTDAWSKSGSVHRSLFCRPGFSSPSIPFSVYPWVRWRAGKAWAADRTFFSLLSMTLATIMSFTILSTFFTVWMILFTSNEYFFPTLHPFHSFDNPQCFLGSFYLNSTLIPSEVTLSFPPHSKTTGSWALPASLVRG